MTLILKNNIHIFTKETHMKKLLLTSAFMAAALSASDSPLCDMDCRPTGGSIPMLPPMRCARVAESTLEMQSFCRLVTIHSATLIIRMGGETLRRNNTRDTVQWESLDNPHKAITLFQDHENLILQPSAPLILGALHKVNLIRESIYMAIDLLRSSCSGVRPRSPEQAHLYPTLPCTLHTEKLGGIIFHPTNIHIHLPFVTTLPEEFKAEIRSYGLTLDVSNGAYLVLKGSAIRVRQHRYFVWIKGAPDWSARDADYVHTHLDHCLHHAAVQFKASDAWTYFELRIPHDHDSLVKAAKDNGFKIVSGPNLPVLPWDIYRRPRAGL